MTTNLISQNTSKAFTLESWIFGIGVFAAGIININWGKYRFFGILLIFLSVVYFPPVNSLIFIFPGFSIPWFVKILLTIFIIIVVFDVGELFARIAMMKPRLM